MIEFTKIFCDLHPNELISNYCAHGTPCPTQNSATLPSVPLVSARTPNHTSRDAPLLTIKTLGAPTRKCRTASGPEYLHFSMKNRELYPFSYLRILSSKTSTPSAKAFLSLSGRLGRKRLTLSTDFTTPRRKK